MKFSEISELNEASIKEKIISLKKEAFNLRFMLCNDKLKNSSKIKLVRKDIARLKTFLNLKKAK